MRLTPARAGRLLVVGALLAGATAATGSAATTRASGSAALSGTWSGVLSGSVGSARRERIRIVVNARETGGSWQVSASCHGTLTLDSISNGYHHYRRRVASHATCRGGDVDCLQRVGTRVADSVTPRAGGWGRSGTLHRVRSG